MVNYGGKVTLVIYMSITKMAIVHSGLLLTLVVQDQRVIKVRREK